ncbi:MAG: substrate-binding domain-containing protein [Spirochaetota bacterium]
MATKYTIGLLIDSLNEDYQQQIWNGIIDEADKQGVRIITFTGNRVNSDRQYESLANVVFDCADTQALDGFIIPTGVLLPCIDENETQRFFDPYRTGPIVSIGGKIDGVPSITVDNYSGMYSLTEHFIQEHKAKRIAYISGPKNNGEAALRLSAHRDALQKNGIDFDENLLVYGEFTTESGVAAVKVLLDQRTVTCDAIICANDQMAFGAMSELEGRNYKIPYDIALAGFDNVENAAAVTPPLTTVEQPVYECGANAVRSILKQIRGEQAVMDHVMPTNVVIRQSCGCLVQNEISKVSYDGYDAQDPERGLEEKTAVTQKEFDSLFAAIRTDVESATGESFIRELDTVARRIEDLHSLYTLLALIRKRLHLNIQENRPDFTVHESRRRTGIVPGRKEMSRPDIDRYFQAEQLLHTGNRLISDKIEQTHMQNKLTADRESLYINWIGNQFLSTYETEGIYRIIRSEFPILGIHSAYITLRADTKDHVRLQFQLKENGTVQESGEFHQKQILPQRLWQREEDQHLMVYPLWSMDNHFGYIIYVVSSRNCFIYEAISSNISSTVQSARVYEEQQRIQRDIRERSNVIQSLVRPMLKSIQSIADTSGSNLEQVARLADMTKNGVEKLKHSNATIHKTSESINKLFEFINVIDEISTSINMLAINASIQSAHAGEYGVGFEVIAEEIRTLSNTTADNANRISSVLHDVIMEIKDSLSSSQDNIEVFNTIDKHVSSLSSFLTRIVDEMDGLSKSSNEIIAYMSSSSQEEKS